MRVFVEKLRARSRGFFRAFLEKQRAKSEGNLSVLYRNRELGSLQRNRYMGFRDFEGLCKETKS